MITLQEKLGIIEDNLDCLTVKLNATRIQRDTEVNKVNFLESLVTAVKEAGGCVEVIKMDMTLQEMLDILAPNDILFYYGGKDR